MSSWGSNDRALYDIDGHTRDHDGAGWDIGADEAASFVAYSVGQTTDNLMTGTPTTTISNGLATFSVAQTGNIGVGDRITFGAASTTVYIAAKQDTSNWYVVTATGTIPYDVNNETVGAINREYTSLSSAVAGATDATHLNSADLKTNNIQLNFPAYYDTGPDTNSVTVSGYTTEKPNYIKIYTPNNTATEANKSQRHDGVWDEGKYRLHYTNLTNSIVMRVGVSDFVLDGLQLKLTTSSTGGTTNATLVYFDYNLLSGKDGVVLVKNNIGTGEFNGTSAAGIFFHGSGSNIVFKALNNIIYGIRSSDNSSGNAIIFNYLSSQPNSYLINNTVYDSYKCNVLYSASNKVIAVNNIAINCTISFDEGSYHSSSSNNISSDATAPGTNSITNATVMFRNEAGNDFRLHPDDTTARDAGTSTPVIASVSEAIYDIQGTARGGAWDIGADEIPVDFVSTICENTSAGGDCANLDYSTLSAWEDAVESDLTAENTRVFEGIITGNLAENNTVTLYISGATTTITATVVATTSDQILVDNISGYDSNTIVNPAYGLIVASGSVWKLNDSNYFTISGTGDSLGASPRAVAKIDGTWASAETNSISISGWNTDNDNSIKIYTTDLARHKGKWSESVYRIVPNSINNAINNYANNLVLDGLSISGINWNNSSATTRIFRNIASGENYIIISNNLFYNVFNAGAYGAEGYSSAQYASGHVFIVNNIISGNEDILEGVGINPAYSSNGKKYYFYNNTIIDMGTGINGSASSFNNLPIVVNNIVQGGTLNYTNTNRYDYSSNNISSDSSSPDTEFRNITVNFISTSTYDFHLSDSDISAKGAGVNLSADPYLSFEVDIDGSARPSATSSLAWDIGADQTARKIYRSVGPFNTSSLADYVGEGVMTLTATSATFAIALPDNVGVGDVIQYDSDNTGGVDTLAFIHGRASSTEYSIRDKNGEYINVASTTITTWGLYRAYTSLFNAEAGTENTGLDDALENFDSWSDGRDLISGNEQWNIALYGDNPDTTVTRFTDWLSSIQNYLKIYTPYLSSEVGVSQRHNGTWTDGAYSLEVEVTTNNALQFTGYPDPYDMDYFVLDGIQISVDGTIDNSDYQQGNGIYLYGVKSYTISNNIIRQRSTATDNDGILLRYSRVEDNYPKINNNIVYNFSHVGINLSSCTEDARYIILNNTTVNNKESGIEISEGGNCYNSIYEFANNLSVNNGSDYETNYANRNWLDIGSYPKNNLSSDGTSETDLHDYIDSITNATVRFQDEANYDFHLHPLDTVAKNAGTSTEGILSLHSVSLQDDIDGHERNADGQGYDIGADEAANFVAYSVGQTTDNLMTGTSTITILNGLATFSTAQTGNIGVGDRISFGTPTTTAYISEKQNTSNWYVVTATGTIPADVTNELVGSITREYTSLSAAVAGATDSNHISTISLKDANIQLNFPAYYDSGADTEEVTVIGYTTAQPNFINIYTPNNTNSEVNRNQRHQGVWDDNKYTVIRTGYNIEYSPFRVYSDFTKISGIQVEYGNTEEYSYGVGIGLYSSASVDSNIIRRTGSVGLNTAIPFSSSPAGSIIKIFNNIIYDFGDGIYSEERWSTDYHFAEIYNNTVINSGNDGIRARYNTGNGDNVYVYNNIVIGSVDDDYFVENINSLNNISSDATAPGANSMTNAKVKFLDEKNNDFRLSPDDTIARNVGIDLSASTLPAGGFAFTLDNVGHTRGTDGYWDIGASEAANRIYRSVGPGNTSPLAIGASTTLSIAANIATFSSSMPLNMGVGDVIQYDSNNDGSVDSLAFVHERLTDKKYLVKNAEGLDATSTSVSDNDWSVYRSYTGISKANNGDENDGLDDTLEAFESWSNGKDIFSSNEQWNIVAYADAVETIEVDIGGWTTHSQNYLRIYTPFKESEVGITQRHKGVWDDSKYSLVVLAENNYEYAFAVGDEHVRIDGLQISIANDIYNSCGGINIHNMNSNPDAEHYISNNIIKNIFTETVSTYSCRGIGLWNHASTYYVWNNIIYDFDGPDYRNHAMYGGGIGSTRYIYNNTMYNNQSGIDFYDDGITIAKNNIFQSGEVFSGQGFDRVYHLDSDNNISDIVSDAPNATFSTAATTVAFRDAANNDFRLDPYDTSARNAGIDLTNDPYFWFEHDIKGVARDGQWDIGADEAVRVTIQPSVGTTNYDKEIGLSEGLVGYWTFDGPDIDWENNIVMDRSGNYNHGTATGSPKAVPGKYGQAFEFDGVDDSVAISNFQFPISNQFSISQWVKINTLATSTPLISQWGGGQNNILVKLDDTSSDEIKVCIALSLSDDCTSYGYTTDANLTTTAWYNIQITYDGAQSTNADKLKIYINGEQKTLTFSGTIPASIQNTATSSLEIGTNDSLSSGITAKLDETRIYIRTLSQTDVGFLYRWGQTHLQTSQKDYHKKGLVGYWSFDGPDMDWASTTAEVLDRSEYGNHGDLIGGANKAVPGRIGQGMSFDGLDDYVDIGAPPELDISGDITVSAWVKSFDDNTGRIVSKHGLGGATSNYGWMLARGSTSDNFEWAFSQDGTTWNQRYTSAGSFPINEWIHIVAVYDGEYARAYINGEEDTGGGLPFAHSSGINISTASFQIGRDVNQGDSRIFNGTIDEVRIYNYALTEQEIKSLYGSGKVEIVP